MTEVADAPRPGQPAAGPPVRSPQRAAPARATRRRLLTVALIALLVAAGGWYFPRPVDDAVRVVGGWFFSRPADQAVRVVGVVEANEVVVSATLTARLVELSVDEGDRVEAGAVIATLDSGRARGGTRSVSRGRAPTRRQALADAGTGLARIGSPAGPRCGRTSGACGCGAAARTSARRTRAAAHRGGPHQESLRSGTGAAAGLRALRDELSCRGGAARNEQQRGGFGASGVDDGAAPAHGR